MLRIYLASLSLILGLVGAVYAAWSGQWLQCATLAVAGCSLSMLTLPGLKGYATCGFLIVTALGWADSAGMLARTADRTPLYIYGFDAFLHVDPQSCALDRQQLQRLIRAAQTICAFAPHQSLRDSAKALWKAHMVPAELALPEGLYQLTQTEEPDQCLELMRELDKACPFVLSDATKSSIRELRHN